MQYLLLASLLASCVGASPLLKRADCPNAILEPQCFHGSDFPEQDSWLDFDCLFNLNQPTMLQSDSQTEVDDIKGGILDVAGSSGLDARFIFATMMQESGGNVRVADGDGGRSRGILQAAGAPSCTGSCDRQQIADMLGSGVWGTSSTDGLRKCHEQFGTYKAASRCYNSGAGDVNVDDLWVIKYGTASYVSDIANILTGSRTLGNC